METIWLEIESNEMIVGDFALLTEILSVNNMSYASYYGENDKVIMEITGKMTDDFDKQLSSFLYYQPILQLEEDPGVSDIDLIEDMTKSE